MDYRNQVRCLFSLGAVCLTTLYVLTAQGFQASASLSPRPSASSFPFVDTCLNPSLMISTHHAIADPSRRVLTSSFGGLLL